MILKQIHLRLKRIFRRVYDRLDIALTKIAAKSPFFSSIYYAIFSKSFHREHNAVICGCRDYNRLSKSLDGNEYLLRRNIHRLEKGLLMQAMSDTYALGYIEETINAYAKCLQLAKTCNDNKFPEYLIWASDILCKYFDSVSTHPFIDSLKNRFRDVQHYQESHTLKCVPYKRDLSKANIIDYESFYALSKHRKSVRWFIQKPVPQQVIDKAVKVAAQSPSACNRQPFEFRIFDRPEYVNRVASIPMGANGFSHNIPAIAVIVGNMSAFAQERDRHIIYLDSSLAAMSFIFALETQGVSSCCINWPDIEEKESKMSKILGLTSYERPVLLIAFGYPDPNGLVAYSQKKTVDELRRYNFE